MAFKVKELMVSLTMGYDSGNGLLAKLPGFAAGLNQCGSCTTCTGCTSCSGCTGCTGCSSCTGCSNCTGCTSCTPCAFLTFGCIEGRNILSKDDLPILQSL